MLKKILALIGMGVSAKTVLAAGVFFEPYKEDHLNFFYNLLFCDDLALFSSAQDPAVGDPWSTLLAPSPSIDALRAITHNPAYEGRVHALAFNRLRSIGEPVVAKKVLGVIVEVPLEGGLDVLAAFAEGGSRYLNQSGKLLVFEGADNPVEEMAKALVNAAQPLVNEIGPWESERLPPPTQGNIRFTFLVSDGLYFGEGPFAAMKDDPLGREVFNSAVELLQKAVELSTE